MGNENDEDSITPFAITDYRDYRKVFGIRKKDRQGHMYVIGKTGTGKSTLLKNLIISDIRKGEGLALIDPHGDLAEDILHFVPEDRMEDVIYFNPADIEFPIAFNPLEGVGGEARYLVASGLLSVFKKVWPDYWGPRLEHILRYSLLTLLEYPGTTLLDLPRLLQDKGFQTKAIESVRDPVVRDFWQYQGDKQVSVLKSEAISPILNKLGQLSASLPLRYIFGQSRKSFNLREVMDEDKILIVNLSKGKIGEDNCSLIGAMLTSSIMLTAMSRVDLPEDNRKPFYFYVDEVHNFLTPAFADILSESRKYGLNLILAHQYIEQLDERVRSAIFGNVGTMISFRAGAEDSHYLAREFYPIFTSEDLISLPQYHIYLKMMIDGATCKPFSARTLSPSKPEKSLNKEIVGFSKIKYGRPMQETEAISTNR